MVRVVGVAWAKIPVLVGGACHERGQSSAGKLSVQSDRVLYGRSSGLEQSYLHVD